METHKQINKQDWRRSGCSVGPDVVDLAAEEGGKTVSIWHIAAKLSHETNLAITKLSVSLIHNTIGLGLPMFINATTRQQISIYSIGSY